MKEICVFAGMKDDDARKGDEITYKCAHGKVLNWEKARRALGLPLERPEKEKKSQ